MNKPFSDRQKRAMLWWRPGGKDCRYEALICDGAVRSGKTTAIGLGFFLWAMSSFQNRQFALCGRTPEAVRRNVLAGILPMLRELGMTLREVKSENRLNVRFAGHENVFFLFGGCDERSADAIQGITLAGVLLDEAVLMPRSFVEQSCARCSVAGSRLWFSCNPASPQHWFYREWICRAEQRNCLYLHFRMEDNPSLSEKMLRRYERMYSGTFYRRYVLGEWVAAEGRVYDFFDASSAAGAPDGFYDKWYISCDYGTVNPASFGLWGRKDGIWYRVKEFYFDSRREGRQMTDTEYAAELKKLAADRQIEAVVVDPSAASFLEVLRREGWKVKKADNDVLRGIRTTADALKSGRIVLTESCTDCLREIDLYVWDERAVGDRVRKENDHAMDDMRYFVMEALRPRSDGFAACAPRRTEQG